MDLEAGTGRCNCSICAKRRFWDARAMPADFRLLTDPAAVADYHFASHSIHHRFCKTCGVHAFGDGHIAEMGGDFVSVNVACLDGIEPETLAALPCALSTGATQLVE